MSAILLYIISELMDGSNLNVLTNGTYGGLKLAVTQKGSAWVLTPAN